eukprot:353544-Chlamydomonas_euryale.AAC.1
MHRRISTIPHGGGPARRDHPPVQARLTLRGSRVPPGGCKSCPHALACLVHSEQSRSTHGLPSAGMHMRCRHLHEPEVLHIDGRTGGPTKGPHDSLRCQAPPEGMAPPSVRRQRG